MEIDSDLLPDVDWDKQPLGRIPDKQLDARLGLHRGASRWQRVKRGLPMRAGRLGIVWEELPLGKEPDHVIAARIGVDASTVTAARRRLGILSLTEKTAQHNSAIDWSTVRFGQKPDTVIAKELGTTQPIVAKQRKLRGITAFKIDWESYRDRLRDESPKLLAEELGMSVSGVQLARKRFGFRVPAGQKPVVDWSTIVLGQEDDVVVARRLGLTESAVRRQRRKRGIAPKNQYKSIDWSTQPLGKMSDPALAKVLGVSQAVVHAARTRLEIPPFLGSRNNGRRPGK